MSEQTMEHERAAEYRDKGKNVEIILKFIRHGERDKLGNLTDYGRGVTRQRAQESGIEAKQYDAVKAIGSASGPRAFGGMPRSLETAHIYAHEIAGDEAFITRQNKILGYSDLVNPEPFDWATVYNASLPESFESLPDEEKVFAARKAQEVAVNQLINLHTPEAEAMKAETAGAFAYVIDHYRDVAKRLNEGSKVLIPAGSHGGMLEFVLQQAMVRVNEDGTTKLGFDDISEIGGAINPSEAFNVEIATDEEGKDQKMRVSFDSPDRPNFREAYLDLATVEELRDSYAKLHNL